MSPLPTNKATESSQQNTKNSPRALTRMDLEDSESDKLFSLSQHSSSLTSSESYGRQVHVKSKIICTIGTKLTKYKLEICIRFFCVRKGPKTQEVESLRRLIDAGMNVARMNFSHGDHKFHQKTIDNLRIATSLPANRHSARDEEASFRGKRLVALMLDTKGPEIRTSKVAGGKLQLRSGMTLKFICSDELNDFEGNLESGVGILYGRMPKLLTPGALMMVDDGLLSLRVIRSNWDQSSNSGTIEALLENSGIL